MGLCSKDRKLLWVRAAIISRKGHVMTEATRPRDQVIVCKGQRNFERIWIWFVISFRPGVFRAGGQGGRPWLGVPEADPPTGAGSSQNGNPQMVRCKDPGSRRTQSSSARGQSLGR